MGEYLEMPDAEALFAAYLRARMGIPVGTTVPDPRPGEFIRLIRSGGISTALTIDRPILLVEAWADSKTRAGQLATQVRAHLHAADTLGGGVTVLRMDEAAGPADLPDPLTGQHRYTATYQPAITV